MDAQSTPLQLLRSRFVPLLAALLIALLSDTPDSGHIGGVVVRVLVLLAALFAVSRKRKTLAVGAALILPAIGFMAFAEAQPGKLLGTLSLLSAILFLGYVAWTALTAILDANEVNRDVITGGVAVYLVIGFLAGLVFTLLELLQPGSFAGGSAAPKGGIDFTYFSFVTLTTLGYGDIVPSTALARRLGVAEALASQVYLAVFIGRLVGVYRGRQLTPDRVPKVRSAG